MKNNFDIYEWRSKYAKEELEESNIKGLMSTSSKEARAKDTEESDREYIMARKKKAKDKSLDENISQEVVNKVSRFITSMANHYGYSEQDAVYAIMQALRAHKGNFQGINEAKEEDPIDIITMDVPLFIRILEYSREDAQADMDLHDLTEKAIEATKQQGILQMDDYDMLVGEIDERDLKEKIHEVIETIKLGQNLNESTLCKRGQDYIKSRKAAGEKSSAYLSGRAVKVCKGDIKFKGKKQKDFKG